jgi:1-acyl-sn-glycerol-3-phosphate acyltransferase
MWLGSLKAKRDILRNPLSEINVTACWTLRFILFIFGHLIYIDYPERVKNCPWPIIFALNHNNYSESILVPCALIFLCGGKKISFLVHWMFKLFPLLNRMLKQINPIWVYNRRMRLGWMNKFKPLRQQDIFEQARLRFRQGQSIGVFPEGTRNNNPHTLKRGRMGAGRMVFESGVPVLPIGIYFPGKIKRRKVPCLGRMVLKVGKPLYFKAERERYSRLRKNNNKNMAGKTGEPRVGAAATPLYRDRFYKKQQLLALYARVSHRIMREISILCGKKYPHHEKD